MFTLTPLRFMFLTTLKGMALTLFRPKFNWIGTKPSLDKWKDVNLILILNHTSLLESIFIACAPLRYVWRIAQHGVYPIADVTFKKKLTRMFYKLLAPHAVPISRKRDATWKNFLNLLSPKSVVAMTPEGRMKRLNGLDKFGRPMTVLGGVADVISKLQGQKILMVYSGGLHHVLAPGEKIPRMFRQIKANLEILDVSQYIKNIGIPVDTSAFKDAVCRDLEHRRDLCCP